MLATSLLRWTLSMLIADAAVDPTPCGGVVEGMVCVPGSEFIRGRDDGPKEERPAAKVSVDSFYMDTTEVTASAFEACKKSGGCRKDAGPNYRDFSAPKQPIVGVNWFDARDYCRSRNKRLPTEAEWELAARGTDSRMYPWGNDKATCARAIINEGVGDPHENRAHNGCGRGKTSDVASRAPTLFGLYDMAGNSWEWVADWFSPSYAACGPACLGHNPKGPCNAADACPGSTMKIVRGGSWFWDYHYATTTYRRPHFPENKPFHHFGFRCAKDATVPAP